MVKRPDHRKNVVHDGARFPVLGGMPEIDGLAHLCCTTCGKGDSKKAINYDYNDLEGKKQIQNM